MKYILHTIALVATLSLAHTHAVAQARFNAVAAAGVSMSQIDGDDAGRYNHAGLHASVGTTFALSNNTQSPWRMQVDIAYTQKGSVMQSGNGRIDLHYIELPVLLTYSMHGNKFTLGAGIAPGVNVGTRVTFSGIRDAAQEQQYRPFDWLPATVMAHYRFGQHMGIEVRWQTSLISIYNGAGPYRLFTSNHGAFNRLVVLRLTYQLLAS